MKIKAIDIITVINILIIAWVTVSTLQAMLHIGTIQAWNFWQILVNLMK